MKRAMIALLAALAVGCDGGDASDAGPVGDAAVDAGATPRREPALPVLGPCPDGWAEVAVDEVTVCDPTPGGASACGDDEARFVGSDGCVVVGGACPTGDFADGLPAGAIHVRPGGAGDGTASSPFGTIADAVAVAADGDTIALAKGRYDELVTVPVGVTLRGACAAETELTASSANANQAVVSLNGGAVRDLAIVDTGAMGVIVREGAVTIERVRMTDVTSAGVLAIRGTVDITELAVRGVPAAPDGSGGIGVFARGADTDVRITRGVFEAHERAGALALGATFELTDVAFREGRGAVGGLGAGVIAQDDGTITGRRVEITNATGAGIFTAPGGAIELGDVVVRTVRGAPNGSAVLASGPVTLERAWITDAQGAAAFVTESALTLTDVVIDGVVGRVTEPGHAAGLHAGEGAVLTVTRVMVRDTAAAAVSLVGARDGVPIRLAGTDVILRDVRDDGLAGIGLYASSAIVELSSLAVERTSHAAMIASEGATVTLSDLRVSDTQPNDDDGLWGRGLEVLDSEVTLSRARFEGQHEVAVIVSGGAARLTDLEIAGVLERGCASTTCPTAPGGIGVGAYRGSAVSLERFRIADAPLCGVQVAQGGSLDLRDGEIRMTAIGACVQVEGYDLARLTDDVSYVDNGTSIQTTTHYVPDANDPRL